MIELRSVSKSFGHGPTTRKVLEDVDLSLGGATFTALMGPSGSGKSTLIRLLAGLEQADSGSIRVGDADVTKLNRAQTARLRLEKVGVIFQDHTLIPELSAIENVVLPLRAMGISRTEAHQGALDALAAFGIDDLADRRPQEMSGGQQQRVGIVRAMLGGRRVLLADEPTGALDRGATRHVFRALRQAADAGVTVLVATHDHAVADFADNVVHIDGHVLSVAP